MDELKDLEIAYEAAKARLEVAEDLRWYIAFLTGFVVQAKMDSWIGFSVAVVLVFVLVTHRYKKAEKQAETAYFKKAKLGDFAFSNE